MGSSFMTSSPVGARVAAWSMDGDGCVTVSERRSMMRLLDEVVVFMVICRC